MSDYKLIWSDKALADLEDAYDLLANKSVDAASNVIDSLLNRVEQLLVFPESGPLEPMLSNHKADYRYLVEGNYKLIYRVDAHEIFIVRAFDTRQDPSKMKS